MNSEIAILVIRSAINILFRRTFYFFAYQKESSFLRKRIPDSWGKSLWNCDSVHKICDKIFFPEKFSASLPAEKNARSWEKNSRFLQQEFLKLQYYPWDLQLNILSKRNFYFITCWKEFLFLRKEFPVLGARVSEMEILLKLLRCNAFLPQEFSSIVNLVSRTSILLERITIEMIILIRILVLKRRICYLGNLEWMRI